MRTIVTLWAVLGLAAGTAMAAGPATRPAAAGPSAAGATGALPWAGWKWAGQKDEHWLAAAVEDELRQASGIQQRKEMANAFGAAVLAWLCAGRMEPFDAGAELIHAIQACRFLGAMEADQGPAGPPLAAWLLEHREARRTLFRALADVKTPKEALQRFAELQAAEPQKVLEYPNLAAAFATAKPLRHYTAQPEPASLTECFAYYTDPKRPFRYNLKKMPHELSRYLADTRLTIAEREWTYKRYYRAPDPAAAYFDVSYDYGYYRDDTPKKISKVSYTMMNLAKVGGVCIDQAYYAAEVCKAIGMPAAIVSGRGRSGIGHAWMTYFQMNPSGTNATWGGGAGRYASQLYFSGSVTDPATGSSILDTQLVLAGSAALLPAERREEAEAAAELARIAVAVCEKGQVEPDVAPLQRLADRFEKRYAGQAAAPKVETKWLQPKRKIDMALARELLGLAIKRNLVCGQAWGLVVALRKADRLSVRELDEYLTILIQKTAQPFPDYSCFMVLQLVPTLPDSDQREKAYQRCLTVYGKRPDLKGKILLALANECKERGDVKKALQAYQTAAVESVAVPEVVVPAAAAAEELLSVEFRQQSALRLYETLFSKTQKVNASDEIRKETSRYKLGQRFAELLRQAGKPEMAEKILADL